jgi:hypothetical protein
VKSGGAARRADFWQAKKEEAARHTKTSGILVKRRGEKCMRHLVELTKIQFPAYTRRAMLGYY